MTQIELEKSLHNDTIDMDTVADLEKMIERKKIEKLHRYKIFYNEKRDAWYTCHPLNYKRRIQRKTKEELLDALAPFLTVEIGNDMTLTDLYPEWLDYKSQLTNSPNTIAVHEKHWNKYFKDTSLFLKPISTITLKDLNLWANALIKKWDLSSKQWQTIKTIPKQIFEYAYMSEYIQHNSFPEIKITVKFRQVIKKSGETQTYNSEEFEKILQDLYSSFQEKGEKRFLAIILNFYLGLRAGELAALQWGDIVENHIHIQREMVCINSRDLEIDAFQAQIRTGELELLPNPKNNKNIYAITNHTKTHKERYVPIISQAANVIQILKKLSPCHKASDYIFYENGKYMTLRSINSMLERACDHIDIDTKRSHIIRKTYASRLAASGYPVDAIRSNLGHSNLATTYGYLYNPLTASESLLIMEKAFSDLSQQVTTTFLFPHNAKTPEPL